MVAKPKDELGRAGEEVATKTLTDFGFQIIERNWRGHNGELDIIARKENTLVAVEVKTRSSTAFGTPAAGISPEKIKRMRRLFGQWLSEHKTELHRVKELRLDAISVLLKPNAAPIVEHIKGIS